MWTVFYVPAVLFKMDTFNLMAICGLFMQIYHASIVGATSNWCSDRRCDVKVTIDSGPVCGRVLLAENSTSYYSFRGIPYAKPPVGVRRFLAPEPPEPWQEPLYAMVEGPTCPARDILYGSLVVPIRGQSEDCLYVNVHVPWSSGLGSGCKRGRGLPVLVFIPGGGFYAGSGNSDLHGPEYLMRKDVIVVVFNYRLGVFGFLSLNTPRVPGNAGLRDQVELLRWVKRNIRAFGGDPCNVTLMGQSAGSTSTHLLSLSKATKGLFQRIILMSGTGVPSYYSASVNYTNYVNDLLYQALGINNTDSEEIYQQLLAMPLNKIMYASEKVQYVTGITTFTPVVERKFPGITRIIDEDPLILAGKGRGKEYPTLVSFTSDEMEFLRYILLMFNILERSKTNPETVLATRLSFSLPPEELTRLADRVRERYFNGTPTLEGLINIYTDTFFKYPTFKLAEWRARLGGAPLYVHQFSYVGLFSAVKYGLWIEYEGAAHVDDMTYVFRTSSALGDRVSFPPKDRDDVMKEWMTTIITNFMRCSNPSCKEGDATLWPAVTPENIWYQNTVTPSYQIMVPTPDQVDMIKFFDSIDDQSRAVSEKLAKK